MYKIKFQTNLANGKQINSETHSRLQACLSNKRKIFRFLC